MYRSMRTELKYHRDYQIQLNKNTAEKKKEDKSFNENNAKLKYMTVKTFSLKSSNATV